ncbi:Lrp/AsnC family transcriptional regulator [Acinetobacter sp. ANC 3926]|uniref:Lrp/AsnC family transcriptional regulator n=1 Tax=Acinetobacter genomosp. 15BJ TaxID=106651 RepID=UPI001F4AB8E6|nr:Lrp/AsnC family transcriptional regulator [Acinetobacter genomosp. 15BJ]MCH7291562.1 Lrp/AsnC family transcriptional regulator [Acinetobacter genomosp. 15BJ]
MDKFDWQIIQALQKNGRLTNQEVGDLIGLSASQCSRRRQLLEQKGVILGYAARIHQQALGLEVTAMIHINLRIHEAKSQQAFQDLIEAEDNIQDAFSISGDADFILKVVAENLEQLSQFVTEQLLSYGFIGHIKSYIVLKKIKEQNHFLSKSKGHSYHPAT